MRKQRRSFLKKIGAGLAGLGLVSASISPAKAANDIKGKFVHMVFFWMKESVDDSQKKDFIKDLHDFINNVDVIKSSHVGEPAQTPREVVDNSYTYCLVVTFESKEDQDIYQEHELHKKFIEVSKDKWDRVQVYDSWAL